MRPPEFTGGKGLPRWRRGPPDAGASMRPPEFTGGKAGCVRPLDGPVEALQ